MCCLAERFKKHHPSIFTGFCYWYEASLLTCRPVSCGCRTKWLHLCKRVAQILMRVMGMTVKSIWLWGSSHGFLGMSIFLFPLIPGPFWLGWIGPVIVEARDQVELFTHLLRIMSYLKINCLCKLSISHKNTWWIEIRMLNGNNWNHLTVCKLILLSRIICVR